MNKPELSSSLAEEDNAQMTGSGCVANAWLVLPDQLIRGAVHFRDGLIMDITEGTSVPTGAIDAAGDYVIPGMIELHTDNLERHIKPRPKVDWPHKPALLAHDAELAGCGITTVFDALRIGSFTERQTHYGEYARTLADELLALRGDGFLRISHMLHLRAELCSETLMEELAKFDPSDRVRLISLMDHTPGQRQFRDMTQFRAYWQGKYGLSDPAYEAMVVKLKALQLDVGARHEAAAVAEAARIGATLASHDDTTAAQVSHSSELGVRLAEFPTTVEAARACSELEIATIMGAPNLIRGGSHSGNVSAADLAKEGLIDILSSDYVPAGLIQGAFILAEMWKDLPRAIATVSAGPAGAVGLADRGRIAPTLRADLVRVGMAGDVPMIRATFCKGNRVA